MAYTAFLEMQEKNRIRFGRELGPMQPPAEPGLSDGFTLKNSALRFLRERCEELLFDSQKTEEERVTGKLLGASASDNQVPYNMEMDTNRLCLELELGRFIDSGTAEDAYNVYFCFLEMFFGRYGKSKRMVELLSEFESNGSSLLMKHRDHYSHSVYVFTLGLALYECNENYRRAFMWYYGYNPDGGKEEERRAANMFLAYWGVTSLFHDIGYPFELPFEQVISYFEVDRKERGKGSLYLAYHDLQGLIRLSAEEKAHFLDLYGQDFDSVEEILAHDIRLKLGTAYGFSEDYIQHVISDKPVSPEHFGYYMDHAYFSAARLYRELVSALGVSALTTVHIDALSAILLHNSLYKFSVSFYKDPEKRKEPLRMDRHPLAWLLMLCDELQCWDRIAYGRNSRTELHPMAADFDFSGNRIRAVYYYDSEEQEKIDRFKKRYSAWEQGGEEGPAPRLKAYSDMAEKEQRFTRDIEKIVDTSLCPLTVRPDTRRYDRAKKHVYLSESNFLHLYDFAVALNGRYNYMDREDEVDAKTLEEDFERMSLEYKLSNINQAKNFGRYLNVLGCFYTDRPVDYAMIRSFTLEEIETIAPMEHERWVREHRAMGWIAADDYETLPLPEGLSEEEEKSMRKALREQLRTHKLAMNGDPSEEEVFAHYQILPEEEQDKDWKPMVCMLRLIKKFDGLRIYRLDWEEED